MAKKPNLGQINSAVFTASQLNAAFTKIDNAFENTLSLDGSTPNAMGADLDMNGNDIINTGVYYGQSIDVEEAVIGGKLFTGSITWRSDWTTSTSYQNLDVVRYNGDLYICLDEHTSGVFATDLSSSKWELFVENSVGPEGPQGDPGDTGPAGQGVPTGGTAGQVLAKIDGTNYNTEWVDQTGGGGGSSSYDMRFGFSTTPTSNQILDTVQIVRELELPADMAGSIAKVGVNPTAAFVMDLKDDGVTIGSISISTSGVATFTTTSGTAKTIAVGSQLTLVAPSTVDATVAQMSMTLLMAEVI